MELQVITMDRKEFTVTADNYDAAAIWEALNDDSQRMIMIGDGIFERTDVRRVLPVEESNA